MKVLCINNQEIFGLITKKGFLKEGEVYTVIETCISSLTGNKYYWLDELPIDREFLGYAAVRFVPCSEIDEKEMSTYEQLEALNK